MNRHFYRSLPLAAGLMGLALVASAGPKTAAAAKAAAAAPAAKPAATSAADTAVDYSMGLSVGEGMKKAGPVILEPIMDVEVTTPQDHVGDVVGDLNRRRGVIQNQDMAGTSVIVRAHVPLKEMFGYISHLRSMTKGRASFTMQFHHYDPVPRNIADEIMAKSA
jgi:translation elongation factor EF-G